MSEYFLSSVLKKIREDNGLSQAQLSKKLGVNVSTIKNAESGKTSLPNSSFLKALANFCKVGEGEILQEILYSGHSGYMTWSKYWTDEFRNNLSSEDISIELCKFNLALFTSHLYCYERMTILTEYSEDTANYCRLPFYYSCLKKGHNPSKIIIPVVIGKYSAFDPEVINNSSLYQEISKFVSKMVVDKYQISGRYHTEVVFLVDLHKYDETDSEMANLQISLTEKPSKDGFSFILCDEFLTDINKRYYFRTSSIL